MLAWKNVPRLQPEGRALVDSVLNSGTIKGKFIANGTSAMNCHAYALRESGFSAIESNDWVEGTASPFSLNTNPLEAGLSKSYDLRGAFSIANLPKPGSVRPKSLITLMNGPDAFVHSGVVEFVNGQIWIKSKMGEHEIISAPIENYLNVFPCTEIRIYQIKDALPIALGRVFRG